MSLVPFVPFCGYSPSSSCARNRKPLRNFSCVAQYHQAAAVAVSHIKKIRIGILKDLARVAVVARRRTRAGRRAETRRQKITGEHGREWIRDIHHPHTLV